jgi:hypothetical protein
VPEMDKAESNKDSCNIITRNTVSSDHILINATVSKIYMHIRTSIHLHLLSWWKISNSTGIHYRLRGKEGKKKNNVMRERSKGGSISKLCMKQIREPKYVEI